jgi:hypothetical protein
MNQYEKKIVQKKIREKNVKYFHDPNMGVSNRKQATPFFSFIPVS